MIPNMSLSDAAALTRKIKDRSSGGISGTEVVGYTLLFIFVLAAFVGFSAYVIWANALVLATIWAWFVVPVFNVAALTKAQAWGIILVAAFLTHQRSTCEHKHDDEKDGVKVTINLIGVAIGPWFGLLIAWVCHHFFLVA